jgi:hypothetical protein
MGEAYCFGENEGGGEGDVRGGEKKKMGKN